MSPSSSTRSAVDSWLQQNGLNATVLTPAGDWLGVQVPVEQANDLLAAQYNVYAHESTGKQTIRTLTYSIPDDLVGHVAVVYPTTT